MISYQKALALLKEKGVSTYRLRKEKIVSESTLTRMRQGTSATNRGIDGHTINTLCALLDCQPGDLMEYIPSDERPMVEAD